MPADAIRDDLLRRAVGLVPVLRERAPRTEQLRQIPGETVKDLVASGLLRIGNPDRYGGLGVDIDTGHEVAWELGRGCGSAAWCASLWIVHNWWLGHFTEQAQEEFFATGPDTLASTGLNPANGRAEPAPGGFSRLRPLGLLQRVRRGHVGDAGRVRPRIRHAALAADPASRLPDHRHMVRLGHARDGQQGHRRQRTRSFRRTGCSIPIARVTSSRRAGSCTGGPAIACRSDF
jgi:hypothetical protein